MVVLDVPSEAAWQQTHIPDIYFLYLTIKSLKNLLGISRTTVHGSLFIVLVLMRLSSIVNTLRLFGYKHTAILDEGILVWAQRCYPIRNGLDNKSKNNQSI